MRHVGMVRAIGDVEGGTGLPPRNTGDTIVRSAWCVPPRTGREHHDVARLETGMVDRPPASDIGIARGAPHVVALWRSSRRGVVHGAE